MSDAFRRHGGLALRIFVSVALLGIVLAYANVADVARALRDADWSWFAAALVVMAAASIIGALRWGLLLDEADVDVPALRVVSAFAGALVLNNVLPTSFGGDAVRAWLVGKESGRLLRAATATIADKLTALACLYFVAWAALMLDLESVPNSLVRALAWVTLGLGAACGVVALAAAGVKPILRRLPEGLAAMIRDTWATLRTWARSVRTITSVLALGLAYQVLVVLVFLMVGKAVGLELSFALTAVSLAIVLVAMLIPISVGGLGVREGGFVLLLGEAGISGADATLLSLLSAAVVVLASSGVVVVAASWDAMRARERPRPLPRQPSA